MAETRAVKGERLACLPMYDFSEVQDHNDELWRHLRPLLFARGITGLPSSLTRRLPLRDCWLDPDLLVAQTCGYPLVTSLAGRVRYLGTPCYRAPGCEGPRYRSWLVVRATEEADRLEQFRGRRLVINGADSLSGCKALAWMLPHGVEADRFFGDISSSGSHLASIARVAGDDADIAAIDCVSWALLGRHRNQALAGTRILASGPSLPALPLITSLHTTDKEMTALRDAFGELLEGYRGSQWMQALMLDDIVWDFDSAYAGILPASATGI
jgi:ABC-type phosphate/phosphonate transport system substrate-binding protein